VTTGEQREQAQPEQTPPSSSVEGSSGQELMRRPVSVGDVADFLADGARRATISLALAAVCGVVYATRFGLEGAHRFGLIAAISIGAVAGKPLDALLGVILARIAIWRQRTENVLKAEASRHDVETKRREAELQHELQLEQAKVRALEKQLESESGSKAKRLENIERIIAARTDADVQLIQARAREAAKTLEHKGSVAGTAPEAPQQNKPPLAAGQQGELAQPSAAALAHIQSDEADSRTGVRVASDGAPNNTPDATHNTPPDTDRVPMAAPQTPPKQA